MSSDFSSQLQSSLGEHYTFERELGGGGMARVFLAADRALERRVVIKVLAPDLAAGVSARRFTREIRVAASLQQANIVPVLAAGDAGGVPYYAMPYVDGPSLRERLEREGPLPIALAVGILRDVARALAYAHEHGIVHRDIKPENILISGETAVVTDFGIAKAISAARTGPPDATTTATEAGVAIGTPAYMSPEQIASDPTIDHRSDIYSFGCVAYELLTGTSPFGGRAPGAVLAAHLAEAPAEIRARCARCPSRLAAIVMRCLEKDPAARPQSAREVLEALEVVTGATRTWWLPARRISRPQRSGALAIGALVVVTLAVAHLRGVTADDEIVASVAVVPFLNVGGDSTDEYLSDGMADGLATALGRVQGIRVVSRTLSYRYKGRRDLDLRDVGAALSADHVLIGSVRRSGDRLRVSAHLSRAEDNTEIWSEDFERPAADAFAVQDEITRAIATTLQRRLGITAGDALPPRAASGTTSPEAYDLYLRGRFLLQRRGVGVRQAAELFEQAIALDSGFARAHASLALALQLRPYFEPVRAATLRDRTIAAAERAIALDDGLGEAYTALGLAHQHAYEWPAAEIAFQRAIAVAPHEPDAHIQYGRFLFYTGRLEDALERFRIARAADPHSAVASGWVGHLLDFLGHAAEARTELQRALEIDSLNPPALVFMSDALIADGELDLARRYARRLLRSYPAWRWVAASLLTRAGDTTTLPALLADSVPASGTGFGESAVTSFALAADTAAGLHWLERATAAGEIWPTYTGLAERVYDPVRASPRFAAIVRAVGLDPRIFTAPKGGRVR